MTPEAARTLFTAERRADALALRATGVPVRYDDEGLQNSSRGSPVRPAWLHR